MRLFTFSEVWGPFPCEHAGCTEPAWAVLLTDEEDAKLRTLPDEGYGPIAAAFIFDHRMGRACCEDHMPPYGSIH